MSSNEYIAGLIRSHWLSSILKPEEVNILLQRSAGVVYAKRETLAKVGEFISNIILIVNGYVKIQIEEKEKTFIIDIISGPNILGIPLVLTYDKYMFSVVSLTEIEIRMIPVDVVKSLLQNNSRLALAAIKYGNDSFVHPMLNKLHSSAHNNIRGRLARLLLQLATKTHRSRNFTLLLSRFEIAQMIGFSRENVIRMLSEFNSEGIVKIKGKEVEVINFKKLEDLAMYS